MGEMMYARMAQSFPLSIPLDSVHGSWPSSSMLETRPKTHNPYADSETNSDTSSTPSTSSSSSSSTLLLLHTDTTDTSLLSSSLSLSSASPVPLPTKEKPFPFMRLPLEIRLQIYHWTVGTKSAPTPKPEPGTPQTYKHAADESAARAAAVALSMSASSELFYSCIPMYFGNNQWGGVAMGVFSSTIQQLPAVYQRVERREDRKANERGAEAKTRSAEPRLLPSNRPVGKSVPTSLLLASRQVYSEACRVGYEDAEFVFVRVFSSALSTAAAFVGRTLGSWQRAAVRHVRMELDVSGRDAGLVQGARDTDSDKKRKENPILEAEDWTSLCASLTGLRNLRLLLNVTESADSSLFAAPLQDSPLLDGLLLLTSIRQIEIELVWTRRGRFASRAENMDAAAAAANLAWCAAVEARLQQAVPRVTVVNVERV